MIWKHFEHLAQPGTAQCFPYCAGYETYIILCRKLGWHVLPGNPPVCLPSLYKCTGITLLVLLCLTAYVFWRFRIRSSRLCSQHFHPLSDLLAPNNCYGTNQLHMLWQVFHWNPLVQYQLILKGQAPLDGLHVLIISYSAVIIWINHVFKTKSFLMYPPKIS